MAGDDLDARAPSFAEVASDRGFRALTWLMALLAAATVIAVIVLIARAASPAVARYGAGFLTTASWDPPRSEFGILPAIWGTLYSSLLAVVLGTLFGVTVAIFLTEDFLPPAWEALCRHAVELLAAIPSVIYGLWGIFVVIPVLRGPVGWLEDHLGWMPLFGQASTGPGLLPASLVLALMILPTITALSAHALRGVPERMRDGATALGATRWEVILRITLPTGATGIIAAVVLALGRALGETMALAMLVGNANTLSISVLAPANTLAALLANNFPEASGIQVSALMYAALVLLGITLLVNVAGTLLQWRAERGLKGLRG